MKISIIGAGYVGLTTAAVLAELGHTVCCVDQDEHKIAQLNNGHVPIYEPGLYELVQKNKSSLSFTTSFAEGASHPVMIICVGTPSLPDGSTDLRFIQSVIDSLAPYIHSHKTIITKSTVPPGTNEWIYEMLIEKGIPSHLFHVVSNPEFLREGSAISDMLHADKIVVGLQHDDDQSLAIIQTMYAGISAKYIVTSLTGAEMIKYASNAFLATKISFINEIARICDAFSVNVNDVAKGIGCDPRIGPHFLQAGLGYGGSCFPKDVRSLEQTARAKNIEPLLLQAVQHINESQIDVYINKLQQAIYDLPRQTVAVLGIAFKPNTDDTRESPAERFIRKLSEIGCAIRAYDPKAKLSNDHLPNVVQSSTLMEALEEANAIVVATDWLEFQQLDWENVKKQMNGVIVLDARNCLNRAEVEAAGLHYIGVGVG
ncbi:UDP-glucose dehydrogenase family protein [Anoxybacillus sp. J5B_2022]|uniref:UDP-glucose dehydrogenase family protein n=1 Tax=Anoxybacillus sp. J5B_2022 TaxID=3003246 RepID=UPI00228600D0|nr:UDP-glucose/GDP-mannose dehydrogenase family protein [Anoxybacillus sp. J5B_2022]MCZ0756161.1 UDP-glucose/GDP-mannose dehydrogenase family protein [Anoxybacillus sp. J5B_2022]